MPPERIHVGARIPKELYNKCVQDYGNITDAINAGLELLFKQHENVCKTTENECKTTENSNVILELKIRMDEKDIRIEDLKSHIYLLDNQLRTKDDQIEKLNENMHKQAVHIQTLIQEISQLNVKLLPDSTTKKPWYKFW